MFWTRLLSEENTKIRYPLDLRKIDSKDAEVKDLTALKAGCVALLSPTYLHS